MHSKDFASQAMHQTSKQFPKAFEAQKKPKMKIPDFPLEIEKDKASFFSFDTSVQPPPLSTTNCFITETTNTDPNLLRSTMYVLPTTTDVFDSMELPFGLVLTPFSQKAIPTELDSTLSTRCMQCQTYVNIFTRVEGAAFYCNICNAKNALRGSLDGETMKHSTIEYVSREREARGAESGNIVSENLFRTRVIPGPVFIFGIDAAAVGMAGQVSGAIRSLVGDDNFRFLFKKVAFMVFSGAVSMFKTLDGAVVEMSLFDDPDLPFISPEFLIDVGDEVSLDSVMSHIQNLRLTKSRGKTGLGDCLRVAVSIAGYCGGAKTAVFTNSQDKINCEMLAKQFIEAGNSLNMFSMQKASAAGLCTSTTGRSFVYTPETLGMLDADLLSLGTSKSAYKVQVEVKSSDAARKLSFYGNTVFEHLGFQEFAQMDDTTTFGVTFSLEESLQNQAKAYVQVVLSFYGFDGSNRTLVMNSSFVASSKVSEVYASLSFDALACIYAKYISMDRGTVKEHSKKVEEILSRSLKFYRSSCCKEASNSQFVLPESIKLLPLLYQSMLKNNSLSNNVNPTDLGRITGFTVEQSLRFFYPRLFAFTDFYMDKSLDKVKALKLTSESLNSSEIYVMENSQKIYLYIGKEVDQSLKDAVLAENTEENAMLRQMIEEFYAYYGYDLPVVLVEEGRGGAEIEFVGYMVEDKLNSIPSYPDYICELHFKVKNA